MGDWVARVRVNGRYRQSTFARADDEFSSAADAALSFAAAAILAEEWCRFQLETGSKAEDLALRAPRSADLEAAEIPLQSFPTNPRFTETMIELSLKLDTLLPDNGSGCVLQFIGTDGIGTHEVTQELARVASELHGRSVLHLNQKEGLEEEGVVVDFSPPAPDPEVSGSAVDLEQRWLPAAVVRETPPRNSAGMTAVRADLSRAYRLATGDRGRFEVFLTRLRESFQVILIDSDDWSSARQSVGLSRLTDGVVMVLDDGTSRRKARRLKEAIESAGGKVLGLVVLEKKKAILPKWLLEVLS